MKEQNNERWKTWAEKKLGEKGKRVVLFLSEEDVTLWDSLKQEGESNNAFIRRILNRVDTMLIQQVDPDQEERKKKVDKMMLEVSAICDFLYGPPAKNTLTPAKRLSVQATPRGKTLDTLLSDQVLANFKKEKEKRHVEDEEDFGEYDD